MCNQCQCSNDMYDRCSIVGCMPISFCCDQCVGHEIRHSCEHYQLDYSKMDPKKHITVVTTNMENTTVEKSEEVTLIINKR